MSILPAETNAVLFVNPDAMLIDSVAPQPLQPIPRRNREICQVRYPIELVQFPAGDWPQLAGTSLTRGSRCVAVVDILRSGIGKRKYHAINYNGVYASLPRAIALFPLSQGVNLV